MDYAERFADQSDQSPISEAQRRHNIRQYLAETAAEAFVRSQGFTIEDDDYGQRVQDALPFVVALERFMKAVPNKDDNNA